MSDAADGTADARALHRAALVWDNHVCLQLRATEAFLPELARFSDAEVDVVSLNIGDSHHELASIVRTAACIRRFVAARPEKFRLVGTVQDILEAKRAGQLAVFLDIEGCHSIGREVGLVELFYDIGVRWLGLVYNVENHVGYGIHDPQDNGLKPFGRDVVAEMDRVGLIKCCSHAGARTAMDVLRGTDRPTIFSHSNPRGLADHPRNISDELIRACAETGGVIGVNGVGLFLGDDASSTDTMIRHIEYIATLVGADHASIALDYVFDMEDMDDAIADKDAIWPAAHYRQGMHYKPPEDWPAITAALIERGFSTEEVRGILGGNLLRVARAVWRN